MKDLYREFATKLFNKKYKDITEEERTQAKRTLLRKCYGGIK